MPKEKGTDEIEEFDLDDEEDIFGDDDEPNDYEEDSQSKIRKEIEDSIIDQLAKGDQSSPIFTGLQKVIAKKDKELLETRASLSGVIDYVKGMAQNQANTDVFVQFLADNFPQMLSEDDRTIYTQRWNQHLEKTKNKRLEQTVMDLTTRQGQQQYSQPQDQGDDRIAQYRKDATNTLKEFAKNMGVSPDDPNLDYGDEEAPLLVRMESFSKSISKAKDSLDEEDVDSVRKKSNRPNANTGRTASPGANAGGGDLIKRASAKMAEQMRRGK